MLISDPAHTRSLLMTALPSDVPVAAVPPRDHAYRPDRYQYTETETSDPRYVLLEVQMMSPGSKHAVMINQWSLGLPILMRDTEVHVHEDTDIFGIPAALLGPGPHTATL